MIIYNQNPSGQEHPDNIICDICKKSCKEKDYWCDFEYATLHATWGYDSKKDCEKHICHMCESCYNKVRKFIEDLGGTIQVHEYGIQGI